MISGCRFSCWCFRTFSLAAFVWQVTGDTTGPVVGSHLGSLLDNARWHKKEMGDEYVSVEHFLLAFYSDRRFGQQFFKNLQLSDKALKDAIQAVRGSQRVTDQSTIYVLRFLIFVRKLGGHDWFHLT